MLFRKTRTFTFESAMTSQTGQIAKLCDKYEVHFCHALGTGFVDITIVPEFGPKQTLRVKDCGITWKCLLYAWKLCQNDAFGSIGARAEIHFWHDLEIYQPFVDGTPVIPVIKLSTSSPGPKDV